MRDGAQTPLNKSSGFYFLPSKPDLVAGDSGLHARVHGVGNSGTGPCLKKHHLNIQAAASAQGFIALTHILIL